MLMSAASALQPVTLMHDAVMSALQPGVGVLRQGFRRSD
jgi:hypothetical protein